jgi:hypothetical protein
MTPGTYVNLGYNNLKGPGVFQLNLALSKTFQVAERKSFQLRAEAFNLPNRLNPSTPGANGTTSLASPTFGQITSVSAGTTA